MVGDVSGSAVVHGGLPYVLLSAAVSIDGCLDHRGAARLLLSNEADLDQVDEIRAGCDAIMVGAATLRRDNPRLLVRSTRRRAVRLARGCPETPVKVTLTAGGTDIDPSSAFFTTGETEKIIYVAEPGVARTRRQLDAVARVVGAGDPVRLDRILADLHERGIGRLLVEGGGIVHTQFLAAGLADELRLAVAPVFVGDRQAPRLVGDLPLDGSRGARLVDVTRLDAVVVLRYALSGRFDAAAAPGAAAEPGAAAAPGISATGPGAADLRWLQVAIERSRACLPVRSAYSVGAVVVSASGQMLAAGRSRECDGYEHAEEAALARLGSAVDLSGATLYSSMEPCGTRRSRPRSCAELILAAGIPRVVFALREPPLFAPGHGARLLRDGGVDVVEVPGLSPLVRDINAHLSVSGG